MYPMHRLRAGYSCNAIHQSALAREAAAVQTIQIKKEETGAYGVLKKLCSALGLKDTWTFEKVCFGAGDAGSGPA